MNNILGKIETLERTNRYHTDQINMRKYYIKKNKLQIKELKRKLK